MHTSSLRKTRLAVLLLAAASQAAWADCSADSGDRRRHLLELYTSEGCSSCPPADRFLSGLVEDRGVVPLAFHVDYWNHLGWPDRFARPEYSQRQRQGVARTGGRVVYTPQFLFDGQDWRPGGGALPWQAGPASPGARLTLALAPDGDSRLAVRGTWRGGGAVFLALYENNLASEVRAGENTGRRLRHDFVVRSLAGPLPGADGRFAHGFALDPAWKRSDLGVAAFVEGPDGRAVTQALQLPLCASMRGLPSRAPAKIMQPRTLSGANPR